MRDSMSRSLIWTWIVAFCPDEGPLDDPLMIPNPSTMKQLRHRERRVTHCLSRSLVEMSPPN